MRLHTTVRRTHVTARLLSNGCSTAVRGLKKNIGRRVVIESCPTLSLLLSAVIW